MNQHITQLQNYNSLSLLERNQNPKPNKTISKQKRYNKKRESREKDTLSTFVKMMSTQICKQINIS